MNYTKTYYNIIDRAKSRTGLPVFETHHIIPKSLGGSNKKDNLIACLKFLGQDYEVIEKENTLTNFWATAIQLWDISVVPKIKTIEI